MALGTITVVEAAKAPGPLRADVLSFTGETVYAAGGSDFLAAFRTAIGVRGYTILGIVAQDCGGYVPAYDSATGKLKVYRGDNDAGADGPLIEVANAVNLGSTTFKVVVFSH